MSAVALIQPGKLGDVIICLPIAKHYYDEGHEVIWPVIQSVGSVLWPAVPYVKFVPVDKIDKAQAIATAKRYSDSIKLIDVYFGFQDEKENTQKWFNSGMTFDQYKYHMAGLPFEKKNQLVINRNKTSELDLYKQLGSPSGYKLVHQNASDVSRDIAKHPNVNKSRFLEITNKTSSIFDWLTVMEKADELHLIDSCFVNLASQLDIGTKCFRYYKPGYVGDKYYPILNSKWITVK